LRPSRSPRRLTPGPRPIRARALPAGPSADDGALRYARHTRSPRPTRVARWRQIASAPGRPPRFPPKPRPVLVMKNDMEGAIGGTSCATAGVPASTAITTRERNDAHTRVLYAGKPVEAEVRIDSTRAPAKAGERVDRLNRSHELELLVSALSFDAQAERRAVASRQIATVEAVGDDRLRMRDLEQIVSLVPPIEGRDDDVARGRGEAARSLE